MTPGKPWFPDTTQADAGMNSGTGTACTRPTKARARQSQYGEGEVDMKPRACFRFIAVGRGEISFLQWCDTGYIKDIPEK